MGRLYFEDLVAGETQSYGGYLVTEAEIDAFGRDFDPDAATLVPKAEGAIASGWLVAGINMRMVYEAFITDMASMGGPGLDSLEWRRQVRAGDRLTGRLTVHDMRISKSRPEMGLVRFGDVVLAQDDEVVMTQTHLVMMLRRGAQERPRDVAPRPPPAPGTAAPQEEALGRETPPSFEMLTAGMSYALGRDHVDRDSVVRFAKAYDPQPFHVDEEAAKRSHFGGLAASGWQTATGWSKAAYAHHRRTYGTAEPRRGQMLGLTALNWRQPVYPGDTISYAMRIESKRPSEQPGFGLVETYNTGTSQDGTLVIDFRGTSLWGMEP